MSRGRRSVLLVVLAVGLLLSGCTTIPSSSSPQVLRTLNRSGAGSPRASITSEPGEGPRDVVSKFISAGVQADAAHSSSRQFLTNAAARKWQDNTTIIVDTATIGVASQGNDRGNVAVTGQRIGQLDAAGIYTPTLKRMGLGDPETFNFKLVKVAGEWRIDQLQAGVIIDRQAFLDSYVPSTSLYFLSSGDSDSNAVNLVPDARYTPLTGQALASWLLTQLLAGPRPELVQSVSSEVPDQVGKPSVQLGDPIVVELPGTAQLDSGGRNALAAQLAYTFASFEYSGAQLALTDAGRPVRIPQASGSTFSQDMFSSLSPDPATPDAESYFIRAGAVIKGADDKPVPGLLGQSSRGLSSVALRHDQAGTLQVAAVANNSLLLGTDSKLVRVPLAPGVISRPEWRPHASDVWFGLGGAGAIYRIPRSQQPRPVSISSPVGSGPVGQVIALRFSPDGVRLAAVVRAPDGTAAAWVGSVVTSGSDVRIDSFEPVTPAQLTVNDVSWLDSTKLAMIGSAPDTNNGAPLVWAVHSDGSQLSAVSNSGLPPGPNSIASEPGGPTLVSASGTIWAHATQDAPSWASYPNKVPSEGSNPIFAG